jgi:hypothetical protein
MSEYRLTKLDRRYNGYGVYDYVVEPGWVNIKRGRPATFIQWRAWAWETFGAGCELELVKDMETKPKWAWFTEFNHLRLYLTEESLTLFKLRW